MALVTAIPQANAYRYRAFVSYAHSDQKWANWLVDALESFRVPRRLVGNPGLTHPIVPSPECVVATHYADCRRFENGPELRLPESPLVPVIRPVADLFVSHQHGVRVKVVFVREPVGSHHDPHHLIRTYHPEARYAA